MAHLVKVVRDGPRGWHWISSDNYDPARHVLFAEPEMSLAPQGEATPAAIEPVAKPRRGRPPKVRID